MESHAHLVLIFAIVAVVTQLMSDAATTALFAPVAAALAQMLGRSPEPFVVTVAMSAVASFLTPIGHHGNLLVYGPGRYRFADFIRVGTPLTILVAIVPRDLACVAGSEPVPQRRPKTNEGYGTSSEQSVQDPVRP
jgi:di/tricarboxylate transporter